MHPTVRYHRGFPRGSLGLRATGAFVALGCAIAGCHAATNAASGAANIATHTADAPAIVLISMPADPDSTLALTKLAMMEAEGTAQAIQWRPNAAILSTRYTRNQRGAGMTMITVLAAVGRKPS